MIESSSSSLDSDTYENKENTFNSSLDNELNKILMENLKFSSDNYNLLSNDTEDLQSISTSSLTKQKYLSSNKENFSSTSDRYFSPVKNLSPTINLKNEYFTNSPIKKSNIKLNNKKSIADEGLVSHFSNYGHDVEIDHRIKDLKKYYDTNNKLLSNIKNLNLNKVKIPNFKINYNVTNLNYFNLIKLNQQLIKILFKKNQEIELFNFKKNLLINRLIEELSNDKGKYTNELSELFNNQSESESILSYDKIDKTFKMFTFLNEETKSQKDGVEEEADEEEFDNTQGIENNKENLNNNSLGTNSPVKTNLQQLFKSKRILKEDKLNKINQNLFFDNLYEESDWAN